MRYTAFSAVVAALLSVGWAQSVRQTRTLKRNPVIEAHGRNAQWMAFPLDGPVGRPSGLQARTAALPPLTWLKPSQDADTVPTNANTDPYTVGSTVSLPVAGDTLLANNAGQDIDPAISSDCHHSFFDSLYTNGAWLIWDGTTPFLSNYLRAPQNTAPDTLFYFDGGIAERYDIDPTPIQPGNSIYIKGLAAQILNNLAASPLDCDGSTTSAPSIDDGDGKYTIYFQLLDTMHVNYDVSVDPNTPDIRVGSYPKDTVVSVGVPIDEIRIGWPGAADQCIGQINNRLERLTYVYFPTPVEITAPTSYYAVVRYELYIPGVDNINDTLFNLIGPAYNETDPCWTADTNFPGRNLILTPVYRQSTAEWIGRDEWYPQYFAFTGRGYALDFLLFPIVYEAPTGGTTGQVIRSGNQSFGLPYPNPVVSDLNLKLTSPAATTVRLLLTTTDGRQVGAWERPVPAGEGQVSVDVGDIPAGAYILQARTPYGAATFWVTVVK
ncbi:MAG: hypothetical protein KatS3mg026_0468 [Bacteroidia bacterium]|nr:MAG: hypothetical protein KatS3mg026_0468 [Bacteroidia bacterium]